MNLSNGWPMMGSTGEIILFACTAIVMVACVKLSKKMPWLKEYGLGIAIVLGIVVGALVK